MFLIFHSIVIIIFTAGLFRFVKPGIPVDSLLAARPSAAMDHFVSVIIPVRNEASQVIRILEEMRKQDFPSDRLEVIVTDDFSEDDTIALATAFTVKHPGFPLLIVTPEPAGGEGPGKKRAMERAVKRATGNIILCTDADTTHGAGWAASMAAAFGREETRMVLGPVMLNRGHNLLQKIQSLEFMGIMGTTAGAANLGYPVMCNGANLGYRRSAFVDAGGYSSNLQFGSGDDQFLMNSVGKYYGRQAILFNHDPQAIVATDPEAALAGFLNQRVRWVSKSRGYRDPVVIAVGLSTWLVHFSLLAGIVSGLMWPEMLLVSLLLWIVKMAAEFPMVRRMTRFFENRELLGYYFVAQLFQLVYVTVVGMAGLFLPYRWKGRKSNLQGCKSL